MNWSDVITFLVVVLSLMLFCGVMCRVLGRRFYRPRAWTARNPTSRGFGCCCGHPVDHDRRGSESTPAHEVDRLMMDKKR